MKDFKAILKETRDAIEKKDFQHALKLSKNILKQDNNNYMALVFLGFALQEVGPIEQAPKAFQKAVDLNPVNPLGWQGFINYYEKINTKETKPQLIECLLSYLGVESNEIKLVNYSKKLTKVYKNGDIYNICKILWDCSNKCKNENKNEILKQLLEILENDKTNDLILLDIYLNCMPDMFSCSITTHQLCSNYLSVLYKGKLYVKLYENAIKINEIYPNVIHFLSWICKIYNELFVLEFSEISNFHDHIEQYKLKLLEIDPENAMATFTEAVSLIKNRKILEAKNKLIKVTRSRPELVYAWILLTDAFIHLGNMEEALSSLDKTKKLIGNIDDTSLIYKFMIQEVKILSRSSDSEDWHQAISLFNREDFPKEKCLFYIASSYISLGNYQEADKLISQLSNEEETCILKVKMYKNMENYTAAIDFMKKYTFNSADWWMELGMLYWSIKKYERSLEPFLKAAKCNPDSYQSFYWLGQYYSKFNQIDKARRCFEKAFRINSKSSQAGCELSKIYRKIKNWDANLNLLTSLTQDVINKRNSWAWFQLGLTYFEQGDTNNSIKFLRMLVRFDRENVHYWESLADAYFTRGSFTSALKCYEEASSLSDNPLYTSLQIANIKKILGEYLEAQTSFENILRVNTEYVPALKGLAEAALCQARIFYQDERLERALDYAQMAASKISVAILQRSELSCLWKVLGDIVYFTAKLPAKYCYLLVSRHFFDDNLTEDKFLEQEEVFSFAKKCFCKAVSLTQDSPFHWQDLAVCCLDYALHENVENSDREKLLNYAVQAVHKCIELDPSNWQYWNLLGCIHYFKESPTNIIQHCFIKAITANHNTAVSWTNLGVLYLLKGDIKLANKAFSEGQRADPNYVNCWIGQALIAEGMNHHDTIGLFRHSIQLNHQEQGCLGYANCVCEALLKGPPRDKDLWYSLYDMHAVPVACDAIQWYLERYPMDGSAWNLYGILQERMGLVNAAKKAFENSFRYSSKYREKAIINLGRLQYKTGDLVKAIQTLGDVEEATFNGGSALALALYKSGYYEESYSAYEQALHWLTTEQTNQSDILVALASMAYKIKGPDVAKDLLFQGVSLKPASPWSLYATLSLALLHKDEEVANLVCKDLSKLENKLNGSPSENSEFIYHYVTLLSYYYITRNNVKEAKAEISKLVHKFPNESSTWLTLSMTIFRMDKMKGALKTAAKCAQTAITLGRTNMDVCKVLYLVALSFQMAGDTKQAFIFAQKAVYTCPNSPEAWSMLIYIMIKTKRSISRSCLEKISDLIRDEKANESLIAWFDELEVN